MRRSVTLCRDTRGLVALKCQLSAKNLIENSTHRRRMNDSDSVSVSVVEYENYETFLLVLIEAIFRK